MKRIFHADLYRYDKKKGIQGFIQAFFIPGYRYIFFFRLASIFKKSNPLGFLLRAVMRHYSFKYGIQITPNTKIEEGLYIGHFGSIIINSNASIGKNCNLSPGVTIGQQNRGLKKGSPQIGNKVWIGTNAVIVGNIKIGDNVLIAPNSYVNHDIPSNSIVIGNPAKIIFSENATEKYIENIYQ